MLRIWIRDRCGKAWEKNLEKWATPLTLKVDVELNYVKHKISASETGGLGRANSINNSNVIGTKLKNREDRKSRQNLGKTELGPSRKYSARQKNKRSCH
jgi:hypothetical protein